VSNEKPTPNGKPTDEAPKKFVPRIIDRTYEGGSVGICGTVRGGDFIMKMHEAAPKLGTKICVTQCVTCPASRMHNYAPSCRPLVASKRGCTAQACIKVHPKVLLRTHNPLVQGSNPCGPTNNSWVQSGEILYRTFRRHSLHFWAKRVV